MVNGNGQHKTSQGNAIRLIIPCMVEKFILNVSPVKILTMKSENMSSSLRKSRHGLIIKQKLH